MDTFYRFMWRLFWLKLCPRPDGWLNMTFKGYPYGITGRIASFFHRRICPTCKARSSQTKEVQC